MREWIYDPSLWIAATPLFVSFGAAIAFYFATETGDGDPSPVVERGETDWEPWGVPVSIRNYRLPGDSIQRTNRVLEDDTAVFAAVKDERKNELAKVQE